MRRREFLQAGVAGLAMAIAGQGDARAQQAKRPNVVLIMADDIGWEGHSCYGSLDCKTPRIDELARTGVRFTNAHSQPLCTPTRVQIMTGRYNHRNYIGFGDLNTSEITFGSMMREAGYKTCIAGKWQLGQDRKLVDHFGFDEYCLWWLENRADRYNNVGELIRNGEVLPGGKGEYGPDIVNAHVLDFIERHKDQPFFCYYPMMLVHNPFEPTPDSADQKSKDGKKNFIDMVAYMDKMVGKIVDKLDALGIRENTLIMFTGDNGTNKDLTINTTKGPIKGGKGSMNDFGTHVAFVANWKGSVKEGLVCEDLLDFSDVMPTIADATGAKLPQDRVIDGRSFLPQLRGEPGSPREWIFCHYWGGPSADGSEAREYARDKRWQLFSDGAFYDLEKDPHQQAPITSPDGEALKAKAKLEAALKEVHAKD